MKWPHRGREDSSNIFKILGTTLGSFTKLAMHKEEVQVREKAKKDKLGKLKKKLEQEASPTAT